MSDMLTLLDDENVSLIFDQLTVEIHVWKILRGNDDEIKTWQLVYVNPPALKTWGRNSLAEIKGLTTNEIFGEGASEHYMPVVKKITQENRPHSFQDYFPNLKKYFQFTSVPFGDYFITTGSDITDYVEKEKEMLSVNQELEKRVQQRTAELESTVATLHRALDESKQLREELRQQAIRDPLTGLYNRRYMEEVLDQEINRAIRSKYKFGIVFLDIDHFKPINDRYGHDIGDIALTQVCQLVQAHVRGGDIACRYGGDELLLILPETNLDETLHKSEQLLANVNQNNWGAYSNELAGLTISLGVAEFPTHGSNREQLLKSADTALLNAKKKGRNCIVPAK